MVRLADLKRESETYGTQGAVLGRGALADGMVRRVYRIKLQQKGATLGVAVIYGAMGATYGSTYGVTLDMFEFAVADQIIDFPDGPFTENALPIYEIDRATYDSIIIRTDVASVDVFAAYADEYP